MQADEEKCHAFKLTEMFAMGRPDIYCKHPKFPTGVWVELKWSPYQKNGQVHVALTPLQRKFLIDEQSVGGRAMWVVGSPSQDGDRVLICAGSNPNTTLASVHDGIQTIITRPKIEPLDLAAILSVAL